MTVRLKSYAFAAPGAIEATLSLIWHVTNLNDNRGLSTAEFCRADETRGIRGIGDAPKINCQAAEHQQIDALRCTVPGAKGVVGGFAGLRRGTSIFDPVKLLHFGVQPITAQQSRGDQCRQ